MVDVAAGKHSFEWSLMTSEAHGSSSYVRWWKFLLSYPK
jgi:hypothetical protein